MQVVDDAGVEVDVHVDAVTGVGPHRVDERLEDLVPLRLPHLLRQPLHPRSHVPRPRILGPVDPVAKAHDRLARLALGLDIGCGLRRIANLPGHLHHVLRRAPVRGAGERRHRRGDAGVQIRLGAHHHPRGERRRIRAVLGVQHHVGVHQRRSVLARRLVLEHVEEIRGVAEPGARRHRSSALADVVVCGHDHRHLRREPDALAAGRLHRVVAGFGIERGERGHRGPQHVHRMRILHRPDDVVNGAGELARLFHRAVEGVELRRGRELAVQQEVGGLFERRVRGEIVDRVAAVPELAGPTIDERGGRSVEAQLLQAAVHSRLIRIRHESRLLPFKRWLQAGREPPKIRRALPAPEPRPHPGARILTGEAGQALVSANTVCADTVTSRTAASETDAMAKMKGPDRVRAALDAASLECGIRTLPDSIGTGEWSYESG